MASAVVFVWICDGRGEKQNLGSDKDKLVSPEVFRMPPFFLSSSVFFMLSEIDEVLGKPNQSASTSRLLAIDTTDTSGEDTVMSQPQRRVLSITASI